MLKNTDFIVKKGSLWSDEILVQGANQHGIVDLETMSLMDYPRNRVTLEPHVWIGRRAILCAGAHIGAGAVVGTGSLVAKPVPGACIVGGNPARIIRKNRTWADSLHGIRDAECEMIEQYVVASMEPPCADPMERTAVDKFRFVVRSAWAKAMAAGAVGAAIFEGLYEFVQ